MEKLSKAITSDQNTEIFPINKERLSQEEIFFINKINNEYGKIGYNNGRDRLPNRPAIKSSFYDTHKQITSGYIALIGQAQDNFLTSTGDAFDSSRDSTATVSLKEARDYESNAKNACANSIKRRIQKCIKQCNGSEEEKQDTLDFLDKQWEEIIFYHNSWEKLSKIDFIKQWAAGEFDYKEPIFHSDDEVKLFTNLTYYSFINDEVFKEKTIEIAIKDKLRERILNYEHLLWEAKAARQRQIDEHLQAEADRQRVAAARRAREAEEARLRAIKEQDDYNKFMARPQPYTLREEAQYVWDELSRFAEGGATLAPKAAELMRLLEEVRERFDIRGSGVKELGDVLFSAPALAACAKAFGVDNPIRNLQFTRPMGAFQLRKLHDSSPAACEVIDALLQSHEGILLLALQTRDENRAGGYARFLWETRLPRADISGGEQKIADFAKQLEALPAEERELFQSDYTALVEQQTAKREAISLDKTHNDLAHEIRLAFQGMNYKNIPSARVPVREVAEKAGITLPDKWLRAMNGEFHPSESPNGDKFVHVVSNEYPYKFFQLKRNAGDSALTEGIKLLQAECQQHRVNMETVQRLSEHAGFHLGGADGRMALQHKEYGINVLLEGPEEKQTIGLLEAQAQFEERQLQQQAMLQSVQQAGVTVENPQENGAITLKHESFGEMTLAPRGYLSQDDFITLQNVLARVQQGPETPALSARKARKALIGLTTWQPEPGDTAVIFDACTLQKLSTPLEQTGHTLLDIPQHTADLPGAKVIIPAVVAYWEMQGRIPVYDKNGHTIGFEQADKRYADPKHFLSHVAGAMETLLDTASHAKIENDGTVSFKQGANPNVIIMETEGDKALYGRIHTILRSGDNAMERFRQEIHGKGEGEQAINRIVQELPFDIPAMIVSDDTTYFRTSAPLTTGRGMPVGQTGTGCYLDAEIRARGRDLRYLLEEAEPLSLYRLGGDIKRFWHRLKPESYSFLNRHHLQGQYAEPGWQGEDIYDLIGRCVNSTKCAEVQNPSPVAYTTDVYSMDNRRAIAKG